MTSSLKNWSFSLKSLLVCCYQDLLKTYNKRCMKGQEAVLRGGGGGGISWLLANLSLKIRIKKVHIYIKKMDQLTTVCQLVSHNCVRCCDVHTYQLGLANHSLYPIREIHLKNATSMDFEGVYLQQTFTYLSLFLLTIQSRCY